MGEIIRKNSQHFAHILLILTMFASQNVNFGLLEHSRKVCLFVLWFTMNNIRFRLFVLVYGTFFLFS